MKTDAKTFSLTAAPRFPDRWASVLDQTLPDFVKERFAPSPSWKGKPFGKEDVQFFSKGLKELSEFFTTEREGKRLPNYFTTARFRSSYFLYFFGLQGAKFLTLFDRHPEAIRAALDHAAETGVLRVIDVGSGPGTASLAFLVFLLDGWMDPKGRKAPLPFSIELHWIDHNETILKDGEAFLARLLESFPDLEGEVRLTTEARAWWKHPKDFTWDASIVLVGNLLNEAPEDARIFQQGLAPFFRDPRGAGVLLLEPAFREAAQRIAGIRDEVILSENPLPIWGPCLHSGKCPLSSGKNWCHFSVPAELPGALFRKFSIQLGGVRDWLKFSYVWFASRSSAKAARPPTGWLRVISDPMRTADGMKNLLCRPERFSRLSTPKKPVFRGEVVRDPLLQSSHPKNRK